MPLLCRCCADHSQEESSSQEDAGSDTDKGSGSDQASDDDSDSDAAVLRVRKRKPAAQMEAAAKAAAAAAKHAQNQEYPVSDTAAASGGRPQHAELSSEQGSGEESEEEADEASDGGSEEGSEEGSDEGSEEGSDLPDAAKLQSQQQDRLKSNAQAGSSHQPSMAAVNDAADDTDDIPFTIEAPASYQAFANLVQGRSAVQLQTIVQRVRACNAIALATDNRRKLQVRCF